MKWPTKGVYIVFIVVCALSASCGGSPTSQQTQPKSPADREKATEEKLIGIAREVGLNRGEVRVSKSRGSVRFEISGDTPPELGTLREILKALERTIAEAENSASLDIEIHYLETYVQAVSKIEGGVGGARFTEVGRWSTLLRDPRDYSIAVNPTQISNWGYGDLDSLSFRGVLENMTDSPQRLQIRLELIRGLGGEGREKVINIQPAIRPHEKRTVSYSFDDAKPHDQISWTVETMDSRSVSTFNSVGNKDNKAWLEVLELIHAATGFVPPRKELGISYGDDHTSVDFLVPDDFESWPLTRQSQAAQLAWKEVRRHVNTSGVHSWGISSVSLHHMTSKRRWDVDVYGEFEEWVKNKESGVDEK